MTDRTCVDCGTRLATRNPAVKRCPECCADVMRAAGLEPLEPYPGAMTGWRCRCERCGQEVEPMLNNIKKGQGGCGWCAKNRVDPSSATKAMRAAGLEPLIAYPGRHTAWSCRCLRCGKTVDPTYGAILAGGGCRFCNDTAIDPDVAAALMRSVGLEPLGPYPGALRKWPCRCMKCHRVVEPCYSTVQRGMGGCRWCRNSGFKAAEAATIYLITHAGYDATKIGISDASGARLEKHRGWQAVLIVGVPGKVAEDVESNVLNW